MSLQYVNVARFSKSSILIYKDFYDRRPRSEAQIQNEKNLKNVKYNGFMSPKTRSKVRKYLSTWLNAVNLLKNSNRLSKLKKKPYLTFVTTTLPAKQRHSDNEIKRKALTPFIETLKRKYGVKIYFWRAEAQKNGNIHFHVIVDSYIHWKSIRDEWNNLLIPLGYIDEFEMNHGHRNPNSTDIHKLTKVKNVGEYVMKYCTKDTGYRPIAGRIHGCADILKAVKPYEELMNNEVETFIRRIENNDKAKVKVTDEYTVIYADIEHWLMQIAPTVFNSYKNHHLDQLTLLYVDHQEPPIKTPAKKLPELERAYKPVQLDMFQLAF